MGKSKKRKEISLDMGVFMNPRTDFAFKRIFGNKELLIGFLNALAILPDVIVDIEYLPTEQLGYIKRNRKAIYDIYVKTADNKRFIIEMQIAEQQYFADRMLFYACHSVVNQAPRGRITVINKDGEKIKRDWDYKIDGVYMVAILDFVLYKEENVKDIVIEQVQLMRKNANVEFIDKLEFVIIELPKFKKTLKELTTLADKWMYSIINMESLSECPIQMDESIFKTLYEEAKINKLTEEEMKAYKHSILEYDDVLLAIDYAEEKGIAIGEKRGIVIGEKRGIVIGEERGIAIGEELSTEKFVHNCYTQNMSVKQIASLTGLTPEQIFVILNKR